MGLLSRVKKGRDAKAASAGALERARRAKWGNETYEKLLGEGNSYDGAQQVIARAKANGTWHDPDAKKAARDKFKLNRKTTRRRIAVLEKRLNGSAAGNDDPRSDRSAESSTTQTKEHQMSKKSAAAVKSAAAKPAAKPAAKAKPAAAVKSAAPKPGVGAWVKAFLGNKQSKGMSNAEIAELARNKFGGRTSPACISWYRARV